MAENNITRSSAGLPTLTKSATKTVLFQHSKYTHFGGWCAAGADGAAGAVFRDTR